MTIYLRRQWPRPHCIMAAMVLATLSLLAGAPALVAQGIPPATAAPLVPAYGLDTNVFMIAGYPTKWDKEVNRDLSKIWLFSRSLGLDVIFAAGTNAQMDDIINSPHRQEQDRIFLLSPKGQPTVQAGYGREVELFSFDTVPSPFFYNRFYEKSAGEVWNNTSLRPESRDKYEKQYTSENTTPGQMILSTPIYGYDSLKHIYAAPRSRYDSLGRDMGHFLEFGEKHHNEHTGNSCTYYFVTNAHLLTRSELVPDTAALLRIELWHDVPEGFTYLNDALGAATAAADTAMLCDTFLISKAELMVDYPDLDLQAFRRIVRSSDLRLRRIDGGPGPMHPGQNTDTKSYRLDIRAFWLGQENVAVRSIAIRDSIGELVLGTSAAGTNYRKAISSSWKRILFGPSGKPDSLRQSVIRIETGVEADFSPTEYAGFERMNQMMRDTFNLARYRQQRGEPIRPGDSLTAWQINFAPENFHQMTTPPEVMYEIGFNAQDDTSTFIGPDGGPIRGYDDNRLPSRLYEVQHDKIPAIKQHNGGRGQMPLLMDLDSLGIPAHDESLLPRIEAYEAALQRMMYGHYHPGTTYSWPYAVLGAAANGYGRAGAISRRTGRRFVSQIGTINRFSLRARPEGTGAVTDTLFGHVPERSELRGLANLSLAYGARGLLWWSLGSYHGVMSQRTVNGVKLWVNEHDDFQCCFGSNGYYQYDTVNNVMDVQLSPIGALPGTNVVATIPNFYIGYRDRTTEIKHLNNYWLRRIGPELMKLRWRDGYSIHYTVPWAGSIHATSYRSIAPTEIFSSVTSQHPIFNTPDSAHHTYVEIGLFDKKIGYDTIMSGTSMELVANPLRDTNYMYVVNRRGFEPPADDVLNLLDTLAGARRISIRLRLQNPDQGEYNFIRVREVMPDTTPLPYTFASRQGLDTVIRADSTMALTLRPGGGALLEISYCPPGDTIGPGDLRFNSQRKIVFSGDRYYSVYWRKAPVYGSKDTVFLRRSMPIDAGSGAVQWEPIEHVLSSDPSLPETYMNDCFPSLTLRRMGQDSVVVTAVWTARKDIDIVPRRFVLLRQILNLGDKEPEILPTEVVGELRGRDPEKCGMAVVSSLHGGDLIAWSDSTIGIAARLRRLYTGSYGTPDSISLMAAVQYGYPPEAIHPSMPPFAHVAGRDSTVGLVWQHSTLDGSMIMYARVIDSVTATADTLMIRNMIPVSQNDAAHHRHPSIDMTQDIWYGAQEGITWESHRQLYDPVKGPRTETWVHFSSLFTETIRRWNPDWDSGRGGYWHPYWDLVEDVQQWTYNTMRMTNEPGITFRSLYPNTSSINARVDAASADAPVMFSVATGASGVFPMRQSIVQYAINFIWPIPTLYLWGGHAANGSSAPVRQANRHAVLYQQEAEESALNTTRQFFAKERPKGYMAHGRQAHFRIDIPTRSMMSALLHDVWVAGNSYTGPVGLVFRPDTLRQIENVSMVGALLRSKPFKAHDSTLLGLEVGGQALGNDSVMAGMRLDVVAELVDSATGTPVLRLDSFSVGPGIIPYRMVIRRELDLLSGTYFVRLRAEPRPVPVVPAPYAPLYPVEELASFVEDDGNFGKLRRLERSSDAGRISLWPNPASGTAEIRFSVPVASQASLTLYDAAGREMMRPLERAYTEEGRYTLTTDLSGLPSGSYLIELRYNVGSSIRQVVEKVVIGR